MNHKLLLLANLREILSVISIHWHLASKSVVNHPSNYPLLLIDWWRSDSFTRRRSGCYKSKLRLKSSSRRKRSVNRLVRGIKGEKSRQRWGWFSTKKSMMRSYSNSARSSKSRPWKAWLRSHESILNLRVWLEISSWKWHKTVSNSEKQLKIDC